MSRGILIHLDAFKDYKGALLRKKERINYIFGETLMHLIPHEMEY